ncbi:hypothetical protein GCM10023153_24800 [Ornithinibacter aureus]|uniref:Uncharacterized protein n=1 Tax=Ornithinibacter aureus TaxID=622664 RepID=A0ABP8K1E6_9MICO|nr:hypothetical protein [Ornithinibacter aureus]KAF0833090.1 hypothetical protein C8E84_0862 [Ornithinibacter aureus]
MSWLGVWLVGLGLADLVRAAAPPAVARRSPAVGAAVMAAFAALAGLTAPIDLVVLGVSMVALALWAVLSAQALSTGRGHGRALAVLGAVAFALIALSGWASSAGGRLASWLAWADLPMLEADSDPGAVLLVTGLLVANLATANVVVRLVLVSVGALRPVQQAELPSGPQPSDQLRGGRLLGPMERVLIIGLGLAGQLTAAGLVIAAKGLIRFPELQAKRDESSTVDAVGIDEVTEYFLVGSFVSWLVALASLALTR